MPTLILASSSRYRAEVLAAAGYDTRIRRPVFDEAAHRQSLSDVEVADYALSLATGKVESVEVCPDEIVIAADQVGVLQVDGVGHELTQQPDPASALGQLTLMSGTTHQLVNAVVVRRRNPESGNLETRHGIDIHHVTMRAFTECEARQYIEKFQPFDTAGSYRVEDDADLIERIDGSGDDGVMGMPIGVLEGLLAGWLPGSKSSPRAR